MSYTQDIYSSALVMLGGSDANMDTLMRMCAAAGEELKARLREGVSPEEIKELFISAAGILALSLYAQLGSDDGEFSSVRVGNISVSKNGAARSGAQSAARLRKLSENMLSRYLRDSGFDFRGVCG